MGPTAARTPAGATTTSPSLFGANDAARAGFMVLRVKGLADLAPDHGRETCGRDALVNRAFGEARSPK